jgi:hypothetical protein
VLPSVTTDWLIAGTGDFNADGSPDLLWENESSGGRVIWFMESLSYANAYAVLPSVAVNWEIVDAADFNSDGHDDILWQNLSDGSRAIWFMNKWTYTGVFALLPQVTPSWRMVGVADFSGDRRADILWRHRDSGENVIWVMNGASWGGAYSVLPSVSTDWLISSAGERWPSRRSMAERSERRPSGLVDGGHSVLRVLRVPGAGVHNMGPAGCARGTLAGASVFCYAPAVDAVPIRSWRSVGHVAPAVGFPTAGLPCLAGARLTPS